MTRCNWCGLSNREKQIRQFYIPTSGTIGRLHKAYYLRIKSLIQENRLKVKFEYFSTLVSQDWKQGEPVRQSD